MDEREKEQLRRWDREHVWHAFTQMAEYEPLIIERAEGCTLYDIDGNAYLDGGSSMWCNVHGHRHPRMVRVYDRDNDRCLRTVRYDDGRWEDVGAGYGGYSDSYYEDHEVEHTIERTYERHTIRG